MLRHPSVTCKAATAPGLPLPRASERHRLDVELYSKWLKRLSTIDRPAQHSVRGQPVPIHVVAPPRIGGFQLRFVHRRVRPGRPS